jgi:hypothetical protein
LAGAAADRDWRSAAVPRPLLDQKRKIVCCNLTEARLIRAYLALFLAPWNDGARSVRLARFGAYEVRLVELARGLSGEGFPLWLELYAHDIGGSLDSCGCEACDDAVTAADEFVARAKALHQSGRA